MGASYAKKIQFNHEESKLGTNIYHHMLTKLLAPSGFISFRESLMAQLKGIKLFLWQNGMLNRRALI